MAEPLYGPAGTPIEVVPVVVLSQVFPFSECPAPHQIMKENAHVGKMVVLVGAEREGEGRRT